MIFRQLFDEKTWTYTYLLADPVSREAVIIDPVVEQVERDLALVDQLGLRLVASLETHVHADHVTGSGALRKRTGAKTVVSSRAGVECADVQVQDGAEIAFGRYRLEARHTPGHTDSCVTYVAREGERTYAFTGDALFVRGCGRTDFQQGDPHQLYRSVHEKIFSLPEDTLVYPGHDYRGHTVTTVAEEKAYNPRLGVAVGEEQFVAIMNSLELASPKRMDVAVPANLACGRA
jgi:glyoxylase-like metal-dependent hydrolase (beta-lactamase superfamily II)